MTKMMPIFKAFYCLRYWQRTNGGQMGEFMGNQGIGQMKQMGQMEDKWEDKWGKNAIWHEFGESGQMGERISLDTLPFVPFPNARKGVGKW